MNYSEKNITKLSEKEKVIKNLWMYIWKTDVWWVVQMFYETVSNVIDEYLQGYASSLEVIVNNDNETLTIKDNWRWIPVWYNPEWGSLIEQLFQTLHMWGKFDSKAYIVSWWMHGIWTKLLTYISDFLLIEVKRDGFIYSLKFEDGELVEPTHIIWETNETWSTLIFKPSHKYLDFSKLPYGTLSWILKKQHFLTSWLRYNIKEVLNNEIINEDEYFNDKWLAWYIDYLITDEALRVTWPLINVNDKILSYEKMTTREEGEMKVSLAFQYSNQNKVQITWFTNNINQSEWGTHVNGLKDLIYSSILGSCEKADIKLPKDTIKEDILNWIVWIVSINISRPILEGQTKNKLGERFIQTIIQNELKDEVINLLLEDKKSLEKIVEQIKTNVTTRKAIENLEKTTLKKQKDLTLDPDSKLVDCEEKDRSKCELFIVEGDSAWWSIEEMRNSQTQALYKLKWKPLNSVTTDVKKILENTELKNLIYALWTGIWKDFDISKLRYKKVFILSDWDCLSEDSLLKVKDENDRIKEMSVKEFATLYSSNYDKKYYIESLNDDNIIEWKEIVRVLEKDTNKQLIQFNYNTVKDKSLSVTEDHRMIVYDIEKKEKVEKLAREIDPNKDYLITQNSDIYPNVIFHSLSWWIIVHFDKEIISQLDNDVRVILSDKSLEHVRDNLIKSKTEIAKEIWISRSTLTSRFFQRNKNYLTLWLLRNYYSGEIADLEIEEVYKKIHGSELWQYENKYSSITTWNVKNPISVELNSLSDSLFFLFGLYISNWYSKNTTKEPNLYWLYDYESSLPEEFNNTLDNALLSLSSKRKSFFNENREREHEFTSILFKQFLIETDYQENSIPQPLLEMIYDNEEYRKNMLVGLLVWSKFIKKKNDTSTILSLPTTLYNQIKLLVKGLELNNDIIFDDNNSIITLIWKVDEVIRNNLLTSNEDSHLRYRKITNIEYREVNSKVYDLEVKDNHNFFTDNVLVHNCDGEHISTLLVGFLKKYMPQLFQAKVIYKIVPPLYGITEKNWKKVYLKDKKSLDEYTEKNQGKEFRITRFKWLGEMNPDELYETCINPQKRVNIQILDENLEGNAEFIDNILGSEGSFKYDFLKNYDYTEPKEIKRSSKREIDDLSKEWMYDYWIYVNQDRAIPNIEDWLKPVHTRLLWAMKKMWITSSWKTIKSARVVWETIWKYHPHGNASVYWAASKLTQGFYTHYPLLDKSWNFGSVFGLNDIASERYTEMKLSSFTEDILLKNLSEKSQIVNFRDNYDGEFLEPEYLPASIPLILLQPTFWIWMWLSCDIPPHNINEVIDATIWYIKDKENYKVTNYIKGPDFPIKDNEIINSEEEIEKIYSSWGSFRYRVKLYYDEKANTLTLNSLPYWVEFNKIYKTLLSLSKWEKRVIENKKEKVITLPYQQSLKNEIKKVANFSWRWWDKSNDLVKIVIYLNKGVDIEVVKAKLYKLANLETSVSFRPILINRYKKIKKYNLTEIIKEFLVFRKETLLRLFNNKVLSLDENINLLNIKIAVLDHIDEVISIIRNSDNDEIAIKDLVTLLKINNEQAEYILGLQLRSLRNLNKNELLKKKEELESEKNTYLSYINNKEELEKYIIKDLNSIKSKYKKDRLSPVIWKQQAVKLDSWVNAYEDKEVNIFIGEKEWIYVITKVSWREIKVQNRRELFYDEYNNVQEVVCNNRDKIYFIQNGKGYFFPVWEIKEESKNPINLYNDKINQRIFNDIIFTTSDSKKEIVGIYTNWNIARCKVSDIIKSTQGFSVTTKEIKSFKLVPSISKDEDKFLFVRITDEDTIISHTLPELPIKKSLGSGVQTRWMTLFIDLYNIEELKSKFSVCDITNHNNLISSNTENVSNLENIGENNELEVDINEVANKPIVEDLIEEDLEKDDVEIIEKSFPTINFNNKIIELEEIILIPKSRTNKWNKVIYI